MTEDKDTEIRENKKAGYDPKKDLSAHIRFLGSILDKAIAQSNNLDSQSNIILGIASAVFVFSTSKINSEQSAIYTILSIFSAVSAITGVMAIHPPKFMRMKNKQESVKSLMGNKRISSYSSSQEYADRLMGLMGDERKITDHYAAAIYNNNVNYYRPKRNLFKISANVLLAGIALATIVLLIQKMFY